jgi:hypothetical protein
VLVAVLVAVLVLITGRVNASGPGPRVRELVRELTGCWSCKTIVKLLCFLASYRLTPSRRAVLTFAAASELEVALYVTVMSALTIITSRNLVEIRQHRLRAVTTWLWTS